jgi:anti-sigma B factor antagonist
VEIRVASADGQLRLTLLQVMGDLDVEAAALLRAHLHDALDEGRENVVIDLRDVSLIDSTGIGALVGGLKRSREAHGSVGLIVTQPHLLRLFELTGLDHAFKIGDDEQSAIDLVTGSQHDQGWELGSDPATEGLGAH